MAGGGAGLGKRREGEEKGRPQVTVEPGPLRALLRHCLFQCECYTANVMNLMVVNVVYFCDA